MRSVRREDFSHFFLVIAIIFFVDCLECFLSDHHANSKHSNTDVTDSNFFLGASELLHASCVDTCRKSVFQLYCLLSFLALPVISKILLKIGRKKSNIFAFLFQKNADGAGTHWATSES